MMMMMIHFIVAQCFFGISFAFFPSARLPPRVLRRPLASLAASPLVGIHAGDEFDVRLPEDFDVVSAKKAWPKRRRSQSPLLVGVKLEQEDQILGSGGGGVTTLLRVSQDMEGKLAPGLSLRAFVLEVREGGTTTSSSSDPTTSPTLILSSSRSSALGSAAAEKKQQQRRRPGPSAYASPSSLVSVSKKTGVAAGGGGSGVGSSTSTPATTTATTPSAMLELAKLKRGQAVEGCRVVSVVGKGGGSRAAGLVKNSATVHCNVGRRGKGGVWVNVAASLGRDECGDRFLHPADRLAYEACWGALVPSSRRISRQEENVGGVEKEGGVAVGQQQHQKQKPGCGQWPGVGPAPDSGEVGLEAMDALKKDFPAGLIQLFDAAAADAAASAAAASAAAASGVSAAGVSGQQKLDDVSVSTNELVAFVARKYGKGVLRLSFKKMRSVLQMFPEEGGNDDEEEDVEEEEEGADDMQSFDFGGDDGDDEVEEEEEEEDDEGDDLYEDEEELGGGGGFSGPPPEVSTVGGFILDDLEGGHGDGPVVLFSDFEELSSSSSSAAAAAAASTQQQPQNKQDRRLASAADKGRRAVAAVNRYSKFINQEEGEEEEEKGDFARFFSDALSARLSPSNRNKNKNKNFVTWRLRPHRPVRAMHHRFLPLLLKDSSSSSSKSPSSPSSFPAPVLLQRGVLLGKAVVKQARKQAGALELTLLNQHHQHQQHQQQQGVSTASHQRGSNDSSNNGDDNAADTLRRMTSSSFSSSLSSGGEKASSSTSLSSAKVLKRAKQGVKQLKRMLNREEQEGGGGGQGVLQGTVTMVAAAVEAAAMLEDGEGESMVVLRIFLGPGLEGEVSTSMSTTAAMMSEGSLVRVRLAEPESALECVQAGRLLPLFLADDNDSANENEDEGEEEEEADGVESQIGTTTDDGSSSSSSSSTHIIDDQLRREAEMLGMDEAALLEVTQGMRRDAADGGGDGGEVDEDFDFDFGAAGSEEDGYDDDENDNDDYDADDDEPVNISDL